MKIKEKISLALKGAAMGIAEVIPGVSGGTIAFITGIYEKLINTVKVVLSPAWLPLLWKGEFKNLWQSINGTFLLFLLIGMAIGLFGGVFGVTHLLENYPQLLWAFFFGLIVASAIYVGKQVGIWNAKTILAVLIGAVFSYWITVANPGQDKTALWFVFVSGAIAISALVLPGVSGSFILVLLGMYTYIIPALKNALKTFEWESLKIILTFGAGALIGLAFFSRFLSWTFKHYKDLTLALLTGFMIGSLNKIWPWRNIIEERFTADGKSVVLEKSVWPTAFEGDPNYLPVFILILAGFALVFLLEKLSVEPSSE